MKFFQPVFQALLTIHFSEWGIKLVDTFQLNRLHRNNILRSKAFDILTEEQKHAFYFGIDPGRYYSHIKNEDIISFFREGFLILDNVFSVDESRELEAAFLKMEEEGFLEHENEIPNSPRNDAIHFVDEYFGVCAVSDVIRHLRGYAEALQPHYAIARNDHSQPWWPKIGTCYPPATEERPLTVDSATQLASYYPGGRYTIHSDNSRTCTGGERSNFRVITAIAYANSADWSDSDGGHLNIWQGTDDVDISQFNSRTDQGREELRKFLDTPPIPDEYQKTTRLESKCIKIAPLPGRVVLFRSTLLHEVTPASRRRRAITQWFYSPQQQKE